MSEIVVPDTIEPVIGYKSLLVSRDQEGRPVLKSPQQQMVWPRGQKAIASHSGVTSVWGWQLVKGNGKEAPPEILASGSGSLGGRGQWVYNSAASSGFSHASFLIQPPEKPRMIPPPGLNWSWEETPHPAAGKSCGCGIYVVSEMRQLMSYFKENCVVARVALWGRVTKAAFGARGEFAYPQEIIGWSCSAEHAEEVAAEYDIPVRRDSEFEHTYEQGIKIFGAVARGKVSAPIRVHAAKTALTTPQFTQAVASFQPSNVSTKPGNPPIGSGRKSTKRDLTEVGVWALIMLFGMFGLNQFAGRPAGMIWWVLCLTGWALWLSKDHKRKENKQ